jgi:hypothetical protein
VALADARTAVAGAAGEAVAASAATGISAAAQTAVATRPIRRLRVRAGKCMGILL